MLLRKIVISSFAALIIGMIGVRASVDFDNYTRYADSAEAAAERFATEPVFPLFILATNALGLSVDAAIQVLMSLGAGFTVFALITLANEGREWGYIRPLTALGVALPFIVFGVVVPRQGLAMGLVLLALLRAQRVRRWDDWKVLLLLGIAGMTHGVTGAFGVVLIVSGYVRFRTLVGLLVLLAVVMSLSGLKSWTPLAYMQYLGNFRETGRARIVMFVMVALLYLLMASRRHGGVLAGTAVRNLMVAQVFSWACVLLYFFVSTDSIRLTYPLSIAMVGDMVRRMKV